MSRASALRGRAGVLVFAVLAVQGPSVLAQSQPNPFATVASFRQTFQAAWARQPEARAVSARRDAALARQEAAASLFAEPPSAFGSLKSDQATENHGGREYEIGVSMPLWLPGERARTQAVSTPKPQPSKVW